MGKNKKLCLVILDGWGYGDKSKSDAIHHAQTPFFDSLLKKYPHAQLLTSGENVGLPDGQMGNSEVGHLNIGAGRIVFQDLVKINKAIREKTMDDNPALLNAFAFAKKNNSAVHLMGLVSDGGVHSSREHLHYLCDLTGKFGLKNVFIHAFTDGRDTDPKSGLGFLHALQLHLKHSNGELVSVIGRYYAMDRDKRWERIKLAYDMLVSGTGNRTKDILASVEESYRNNVTDEFIKPIVKTSENNTPVGRVRENDVVICFNFRTDRCREITLALTQNDFPEYGMKKMSLHYVTMTNYDNTFRDVSVVFEKDNLTRTLGEVISSAGKTQLRIAETEKYPHVTFFFSGGREAVFEGEKRIMVPSPKVPTYDLKPEMSAPEVTDAVVKEISAGQGSPDFICLNYANPDMVGHTGVYSAIIKAVETVDNCLRRVVEAGIKNSFSFIVIADHGNADYAINPDGSPNTAHSLNPVPCIVIDTKVKRVANGILADVAPTILKIMGLEIPPEMTGRLLV
jgi:2,3-bisphosphoglycerate-independent phosphoglycerate mutase